ncbi:MAG TPA: response regulator transcription factor [Ramlibacter sp.]|jgi:DNA-binding NarL/FixJ family response regulator|nr:response regulator transcription factor [Ramlibacter sp.]
MQAFQMRSVRVFIVAPPMLCWGLERLVQSEHPRLELSGTAPLADFAPASLVRTPADVIVFVLESADELGGLAFLQSNCKAKFLVVTSVHDAGMCDQAVLAGARGVVRTWDPPHSLVKAIEKVDEGELWIDRSATSRIFLEMARQKAAEGSDPEKTKISTLTRRERQMIAAFASDSAAPAKVIARRLCISEHTLRNHLTSIYNKLDVTNRLDLYAYATRHGLNQASP